MKTLAYLACLAAVGMALQYAGVPHGLLLGSILAASIVTSRFGFAPGMRFGLEYVQIVLGMATGLLFKSWDTQMVVSIVPSLGVLLVCLAAQVAVGSLWLSRVSRWNRTDALLAVYPGALAAVFDLLESERASSKVIVVHLVRLISITMLVSFFIPVHGGVSLPATGAALPAAAVLALAVLVALCVLVGRALLGLGVPAPFMITAIVLTGVFVKAGWLHAFEMPTWSVDAASVILGALIGAQFRQISIADGLRYGRTGLVCIALMLMVAGAFAWVTARLSGYGVLPLWLSYAPGAIETITIVAYGGGLSVVFVLMHHLTRLVVLHFAPAVLVRARRRRAPAIGSEAGE
ncbi:ammonia monooxygenase [Burkholderia cepacia]|uniref:AbrB family transcriptional regulator n=1 Tax=Burkholderia cepacia TaxID=292 RepID=A0AAQ0JKH6_BURCE|nr:AbrB family transcriptional regulator [Burkholderia cepacia]KVH72937.1 ammonia monooxygenase [Burkholderia cepacia]KWC71773.1 ammonia monooxygenase [Burkholderia cepacia]RAQ12889.1 AbrB family transcriptional regulator [Burkholderia cepacia]